MSATHSFSSTKSDGGDATLVKPSDWNGLHVPLAPIQVVSNATNSNTLALTLVSPLSTSIFFVCYAGVATLSQINSITQTNVTWSLLRRKVNGTNTGVELWVGIASGAPGTSVTGNFSASTNSDMCVLEVPAIAGLAGTVDQAADATGTNSYQNSGIIKPTSDKALTFVLFGCNNGTILMTGPTGPFYPLVGPSFMAFGYCWGGKNTMQSNIPNQTNSVWANMIISVV